MPVRMTIRRPRQGRAPRTGWLAGVLRPQGVSLEQFVEEHRYLARDRPRRADGGQAVRFAPGRQGFHRVFRLHGLGQERSRRIRRGRGPHDQVDLDRQEEIRHLQPGRHLDGGRPRQVRRQGRGQARRGAELPRADLHLVVPDAVADRRVDLLHAPDAGRRQGRRVQLRQEQGAHAGRGQQHGHLRRRRRAATKPRKKSPNSSSSCATRPNSRSSAAAFRAAC